MAKANETTVVATTDSKAVFQPTAAPETIRALGDFIGESRQFMVENAGDAITLAIGTAKAIQHLRTLLNDDVMKDIMLLMDAPGGLGFKTDRAKGNKQPYSVDVVRNVLIAGSIAGANISGNEINILAGNLYLTKEFMERAIKSWPSLTNFVYSISPPAPTKNGVAICGGRASWMIRGQQFEVVAGIEDSHGVKQPSIAVKAYDSSSVDEIRGKAESKLFRRVFQVLTGMNLDFDENGEFQATTLTANSVVPKAIDSEPEASQTETEPVAESKPATDTKPVEKKGTELMDPESLDAMVGAFSAMGVSAAAIEAKFEKTIGELTIDDQAAMKKVYSAINNGEHRSVHFAKDAVSITFDAVESIQAATDKAAVDAIVEGAEAQLKNVDATREVIASQNAGLIAAAQAQYETFK